MGKTLLIHFLTFDFVLYFVISVLDPHKVSRISSQKKARLSEDTSAGDPEATVSKEMCDMAKESRIELEVKK